MTKPTRPKGLPTESSIQPPLLRDGEPCDHPGCLSHVSHPCEGCGRIGGYKPLPPGLRLHLQMGRDLSSARYENTVYRECLALAMETLELYTEGSTDGTPAQGTLVEIEACLAPLEEETR